MFFAALSVDLKGKASFCLAVFFGPLVEWPAVIPKIQLHSKGIASHKAKAAFEAQEDTCGGSKKRKR